MRAGSYYVLLTKILLFIGHYTTDIIVLLHEYHALRGNLIISFIPITVETEDVHGQWTGNKESTIKAWPNQQTCL